MEHLARLVGHGGEPETVLTEHLQGHPLHDLALPRRLGEEGEVRVRVHVDEAGRHVEPVGVDRPAGRLAAEPSHGHDPVTLDPQVGVEPGVAGSIDDTPTADDDVEHGSVSSGMSSYRRVKGTAASPATPRRRYTTDGGPQARRDVATTGPTKLPPARAALRIPMASPPP